MRIGIGYQKARDPIQQHTLQQAKDKIHRHAVDQVVHIDGEPKAGRDIADNRLCSAVIPNGRPVSPSCNSPITVPVIVPAMGLRRDTAK